MSWGGNDSSSLRLIATNPLSGLKNLTTRGILTVSANDFADEVIHSLQTGETEMRE